MQHIKWRRGSTGASGAFRVNSNYYGLKLCHQVARMQPNREPLSIADNGRRHCQSYGFAARALYFI